MDEAQPLPPENQPLNIYEAKLTFSPRNVVIQIRYTKRDSKNRKLPFPDRISKGDLAWSTYQGELISVYHRTGDGYKYRDMNHNAGVPFELRQRLEELVRKVT